MKSATVAAFDRYIRVTEARMDDDLREDHFLFIDRLPDNRRREIDAQLREGKVNIQQLHTLEEGRAIPFPGGMIHHWVGVIFIPNAILRHGTTSLFAALEVRSGRVVGDFHARHRSVEFRKFLERIEAAVPDGLDVHLILDNYGTHKASLIHRWLARHPRYYVHFTPTSASWLNLVERWFAALTEKQIRRGVHRSTRELEQAIRTYIETTNARPKPFVWTKTADEILASVARFCKRTSDSGH
jgi:transposase